MSRLGKKLRANGWSRLPDYGYIVYKKNDMKITYCDINNDYYYLSNVDGTIIAYSKYLINDNFTISKRHKFFEMFIKARNFVHAKSIMDNYLLEAMIDKTL